MAKTSPFLFDPSAFSDFFNASDFSKFMQMPDMPTSMNPAALIEFQKKNMDAFVSANKAAADAYQDLFKKQVEVFQATMDEARKHAESVPPADMSPDAAKKRMDYAQATMKAAMDNMTALAEETRKANADAFKTVQTRVQASIEELSKLSK